MKIAVITQNFPLRERPYRGHSVYQTVLRMSRMADVKVYSAHPRYLGFLQPRNQSWRKVDTSYSVQGVDAQYLNYPAIAGITRPLNGFTSAYYLESLLKNDRPDLILCYWIYPDGFAAVRLGKKFRVPVIVKSMGSDLMQHRDALSRRLTRYVLRTADRVLTVSHDLRQVVISMGVSAQKVTAVLNGCDGSVFYSGDQFEARSHLGTDFDSALILYVGRLDLAKGLLELVDAIAELRCRNTKKVKLILIGDGPAEASIRARARQLDIEDLLSFTGPLSSHDVAQWMRAADLLALPSHREGCPNVVLEALSCGLPIVASNVGGVPEIVSPECGILVPPGDRRALVDGLHSALGRSWNRRAIASEMTRTWEQVATETLEACQSTLGRDGLASLQARGGTSTVK